MFGRILLNHVHNLAANGLTLLFGEERSTLLVLFSSPVRVKSR